MFKWTTDNQQIESIGGWEECPRDFQIIASLNNSSHAFT